MDRSNRSTTFGLDLGQYLVKANDNLLTVAQIETEQAVGNAVEVGAVEGVDAPFVGPLDLSVNLGAPQQYEHPVFRQALN